MSKVKSKEAQQFDAVSYIAACGSVSAAIRKLNSEGKSRAEIAELLQKRYQHVRNVLITPVKNPK